MIESFQVLLDSTEDGVTLCHVASQMGCHASKAGYM